MLNVQNIKINHLTMPKGIAGPIQTGWEIVSDHTGVVQTAYQIQISEQPDFQTAVYDSGRVESDESANVMVTGISWKSVVNYFSAGAYLGQS